jgi:uncharacterized protein
MINTEDIYNVIPKNVVAQIFKDFELDIEEGEHGLFHWSRVIENGLTLAELNDANPKIIIAFGLFHDCKRENDNEDPEHGNRGGNILREYREFVNLTDEELEKAALACDGHTNVLFNDDLDIATCWDSDRLDLYRVGIYPDPLKLNTIEAQDPDFIEERSILAENCYEPMWSHDIVEEINDFLHLQESNNVINFLTNKNKTKKTLKNT